MIKSFRCKKTQALFEGERHPTLWDVATVAERKLHMLDSATTIEDLRVSPGNRLEALRGDREGQWSIRVNDQLSVCFRFENGNAFEVEIADCH